MFKNKGVQLAVSILNKCGLGYCRQTQFSNAYRYEEQKKNMVLYWYPLEIYFFESFLAIFIILKCKK